MEQDADLNIASNHVSSSSTIFCLMAKSSKNDGDDKFIPMKSEVIRLALGKNKNAWANFFDIMNSFSKCKCIVEDLGNSS